MIRIRQALESDLPWLLLQQQHFDQFYGTARSLFPKDHQTAFAVMTEIVRNQVVLVAEKELPSAIPGVTLERKRVGFIAGALGPHPYNPDLIVLSEQFWWVAPEYRGGSAGARLLEEFLDFGKENAHWIVMTLEAKSPIDPASLERKGFRVFETSFLLEI